MSQLVAALFAGGRGRRMGGVDKALIEIDGRPLWQIASEKLLSVSKTLIVTGPEKPDWLQTGFVPDVLMEGQEIGPAGGLLAALKWALKAYGDDVFVFTAPVDAPFFSLDLPVELMKAAGEAEIVLPLEKSGSRSLLRKTGISPEFEDKNPGKPEGLSGTQKSKRLQPAFGLWKASIADRLETEIRSGERALYKLAETIGCAKIPVDFGPHCFFNINTADDLTLVRENAKEWLDLS